MAILFQFAAMSLLILMVSRVVKSKAASTNPSWFRLDNDNRSNMIIMSIIVVNFIVWCLTIITVVAATKRNSAKIYNTDIVLLASVCFLEATMIFFVGLFTGLRISRELSPIYTSRRQNGGINPAQPAVQHQCNCSSLCQDLRSFMRGGQHGEEKLQMQSQILRQLVIMSSVVSLFFLIRSLCFIYSTYLYK